MIELLMVLALMAILAAWVLPTFGTSAPSQLRGAARMLAADIQYAQSMAISTGRPVWIEFLDGNRYRAVDPTGGQDGQPIVLAYPGGDYPAHDNKFVVDLDDPGPLQNVAVELSQFGGQTRLEFGRFGEPAAGGEVGLRCGNYRVRVTVAPVTGRVSIGDLEKL